MRRYTGQGIAGIGVGADLGARGVGLSTIHVQNCIGALHRYGLEWCVGALHGHVRAGAGTCTSSSRCRYSVLMHVPHAPRHRATTVGSVHMCLCNHCEPLHSTSARFECTMY